jgi:hypothetical protein
MKRLLALLVVGLLLVPVAGRAETTLLTVNDGDFFYDVDNDCAGDTDDFTLGVATRHWHVGIPFAPAAAEAAAGMGCLGGPKTWTVTIGAGKVGTLAGSIRYTWDQDVPGGCCNDVHLNVFDASGALVDSTLLHDGPKPVIPTVEPIRSHPIDITLKPGTYTVVEDIFSGEHTAWLTKLEVTEG